MVMVRIVKGENSFLNEIDFINRVHVFANEDKYFKVVEYNPKVKKIDVNHIVADVYVKTDEHTLSRFKLYMLDMYWKYIERKCGTKEHNKITDMLSKGEVKVKPFRIMFLKHGEGTDNSA